MTKPGTNIQSCPLTRKATKLNLKVLSHLEDNYIMRTMIDVASLRIMIFSQKARTIYQWIYETSKSIPSINISPLKDSIRWKWK